MNNNGYEVIKTMLEKILKSVEELQRGIEKCGKPYLSIVKCHQVCPFVSGTWHKLHYKTIS